MGPLVGALVSVPWGTVIETIPAVVDGASKLLRSIGVLRSGIALTEQPGLSPEAQFDPAAVLRSVAALEASLLALSSQVADATRLIADLGATNEALVRRATIHRQWLWLLSVVVTALAGGLAFAVAH